LNAQLQISNLSRDRRAFSLVELIAVIGIISVLTSLLMPALHMARQHAEQVKCAAQLRQLGLALSMYSNDNHGWLPTWSGWHVYPSGSSPEDEPGPSWEEKLMPWYVRPDSVAYSCPSFIATAAGDRFNNYFIAARWSSFNGRHSMKLTDVKMSGRFVLSGDVSQLHLYPFPYGVCGKTTDDCDRDDAGENCAAFAGEDPGGFSMHRGGNNIMFDDLHVGLFDHYDPSLLTFHPFRMSSWYDVNGN